MMETILYLYKKSKELVSQGHPMSILKQDPIFEKVIAIKYDVPNDKPEMFESCKERWERGEISARKAAKQLQVSHNTFLKWVRREKMETKTNENRIEM